MPPIQDHPLRYQLVNELHARPFPVLNAPCRAAYLAIKQPQDAAARDRDADRTHLLELLDRYAAPHPDPGATHYFGKVGKHWLKWESHTEFVTYTIIGSGVADKPFDAATFAVFPDDWLEKAPGARITSALIRIEELENGDEGIDGKVDEWFVGDALAISRVVDDHAIIAGDFRLDSAGHMRFAVFARKGTDARRIGRIVQRLCEIETYKTMSMLGLTRSRAMAPAMGQIDNRLTTLMADMTRETASAEETLKSLLDVSSELENMLTKFSFRFGATQAYSALVTQRIAVLREERFKGRQTFQEFMNRRYDPAMRTVRSTEERLRSMSDRALRAGNLLRTRVDVERSAQNQTLLESMDRRADLQLRLQRTVEGLSVVAISYYAVNLVAYMAYPAVEPLGVARGVATALATPVVVLLVWLLIRRLRREID